MTIRPRDDAVISVGHTGSLQVIGPPSFITIQTLQTLQLSQIRKLQQIIDC